MKDVIIQTLEQIWKRMESLAMHEVLLAEQSPTFEGKVAHQERFREFKKMQADIKEVQTRLQC